MQSEQNINQMMPIMSIEHDCILSKQGDVTLVYKIRLPEIFTLSESEYETFHQSWVRAIKTLPSHSILHKQDWHLKRSFDGSGMATDYGFIADAARLHFNGRPYLHHECYILITKKPEDRKIRNSLLSSLLSKTLVPEETLSSSALQEFLSRTSQFKRILEDSGLVALEQLKSEQLQSFRRKTGLIEKYCFLSEKENDLQYKDLDFNSGITIGEQHARLYTLGDAADLPHLCGSRITYDKFSTDKTRFPVSFACALGLLLDCNHIYNQYIFIEEPRATIKKLETKRLRLQSLSAYSRENSIARDAVNDFLNEAISQQRLPVKAHFNVLAWTDDPAELPELKNKVSSALAQMDAAAKPELTGAPQIWWAGIPGNAAEFPMNDTFDTFAEQACCFFTLESGPETDLSPDGIRFCDRLGGTPVYTDLFVGPRAKGISSNMGTLVCGSSGGGKSMTVNHILRSLYDQGAHCVTVDIGGSYKGLCELVKGYYFTYTEENPIRFNPFYIPEGEKLDVEKKENLKAMLATLWKKEAADLEKSEYVALSDALLGYYGHLDQDKTVFPCFNTFYEFVKEKFAGHHAEHKLATKDFDLHNFLYVLRPFYKGGEFDYLLNARENLDLLQQRFIVIELDNIKDHPVLFPVVTLIIMEIFISKIRKLGGVKKVLTVDEAWKAIAKSGMASFLQYAFKTIRKFFGIPIVVTQEVNDLISSPIIKEAIIANADIKILMDMSGFINKFDQIAETLGLSEKAKTILLSVKKEEREIFVDIAGKITRVYKNELSPEEYYAYTTDGAEKVMVDQLSERYGSREKGIAALIQSKRK
ncbi:MAG: TraG family conjugative transposon ATPase [Bacteroidota bacterium]